MTLDYCDFDEPFPVAFIEIAIPLGIFMTLQILLFYDTLHSEYKRSKAIHTTRRRTKLSLRVTYVALQLCGFCFTFLDVLRFVIDPYTKFIQHNDFGCAFVAYSPKVITIIYVLLYLSQVLLRLQLSFKGSFVAISKRTFLFLGSLILIPGIFVPILFFIFLEEACIWKWNPMDMVDKHDGDFAFCDWHSQGIANTVIATAIIWITITNIIYAVLFGTKLYAVLRNKKNNNVKLSFQLKSLIIKNTILTLVVSISTLINWFMWLSGAGIVFLYFDIWFNCFIIGMMFSRNDKYYKKLCKVCIVCCFMDCDKTFNKNNEYETDAQRKRTNKYLHMTQMASMSSGTAQSQSHPSTLDSNTDLNASNIKMQKVRSVSDHCPDDTQTI